MGLAPDMWGISMQQLHALRRDVQAFYEAKGEAAADKSMRDVVEDIIKPTTRDMGVGYALLLNRERPVRAQYMVSHSWNECFFEFVDALAVVSASIGEDGLWICALSIYQKENDDFGHGPTIAEQLGEDVLEGPFAVVVRAAKRMLVVQTRQAAVYTRLWCVLELYQAVQMRVDVRLLGAWTWEASRTVRPQHATCHDPQDAAKIRRAVESTCGWAALESTIVRHIKLILATRAEWPIVRPWEWKLLEAMRRDDAELVREAAADPEMDWTLQVGDTYGDPDDTTHVYHLIMSFGLQWRVGHTLMETARLNGCGSAAAAIEGCGGGLLAGESCLPEGAAPKHATRDEGPAVRRAEWKLLEAIRLSDVALVREAAAEEVNWHVQVGEMYGDAGDDLHVYYLAASFGLDWRVGDTLLQTARLNGSLEVARAMELQMAGHAEAAALTAVDETACASREGASSSKMCAVL